MSKQLPWVLVGLLLLIALSPLAWTTEGISQVFVTNLQDPQRVTAW